MDEDRKAKLVEMNEAVTDSDINKMISILDEFTWENVDDFYVCGRMWPVHEGKEFTKEEIEREFVTLAVMKYFDINNYIDLTEEHRMLGVLLYTKSLTLMETYKVRERLDMLYKDA